MSEIWFELTHMLSVEIYGTLVIVAILTVSLKLGVIVAELKRLNSANTPIFNVKKFDKNGRELYSVDANLSIKRGTNSDPSWKIFDPDGSGGYDFNKVIVSVNEIGKRVYKE